MPDFEPLFELKENLYRETCPILLQSGVLAQEPVEAEVSEEAEDSAQTLRSFVRLTFRNLDARAVTAVFIDLHVFDKANHETEVVRDRRYLVPVVGRDETFGMDEEIPVGNTARSISVAIKKVEFEGEDVWTGSASLLFEHVPARQPLSEAIEDEKLLGQYSRDFREMTENDRGEAQFVPEEYKDLWLCACGEINRADEERCYVCGAAYAPQRELYDDPEKLAENLEAYEKAEAEKAEQARLAAERKAAEEKAAAEEAARRAAEEKAAAEERARKKKLHRKIFLSISIPLLVLIAAFIVVLITYIIPQQKYDAAAALLEAGQYDEAVAAFAELEDYSDSADRIPEAKYRKAAALLEAEKYDEAIAAFGEIPDYQDSADQITEAQYRKAVKVFDSGAYEDALGQLEKLADYKEAAEKIELCYFNLGMKAIEADNLKQAAADYKQVSGALAAQMQEAFCDKGIEFYTEGDEAHALEYFAFVTEASLLPKIDAAYYEQGLKLVEEKAYDEAMEIFTKLGEYEDCAVQIQKIHYLKAQAFYKDAKYEQAIEEYKAAGDYENASKKITEATYRLGVQQLNNGEVVKAYETLYPIRSYNDAYMLLITNSKFYMYVYDPGVGPNPMDEH
ncbi:MAG: hypothetical protein ACI4GO_01750 [Hominenteromicrobium sp.]